MLCPSQAVCVCHRQTVSVTVSLRLSQTVSVKFSLFLLQIGCVCHIKKIFVSHLQSVSVTDNLHLSLVVCVCHIQSMSHIVCVWQYLHRHSVSVTDSMCLSQTVCVCHKHPVSDTESLCLHHTFSLKVLCWHPDSIINEFCSDMSMCLEFVCQWDEHFVDPCPLDTLTICPEKQGSQLQVWWMWCWCELL